MRMFHFSKKHTLGAYTFPMQECSHLCVVEEWKEHAKPQNGQLVSKQWARRLSCTAQPIMYTKCLCNNITSNDYPNMSTPLYQ